MPFYIPTPDGGSRVVDEEEYLAWVADNTVETTQGDPVVGGYNKTSVSTGDGAAGYQQLVQPWSGTGLTSYVPPATAPAPYGEPLTRDELNARRAELELLRQQREQSEIAGALWTRYRMRASTIQDGGGGGYPEVEVDDPQGPVVSADDIPGAGIDDAPDPTIDPRTPEQIAADDRIIAQSQGVDTRTPDQIAADDRIIAAATGVKIAGANAVDTGFDTGLSAADRNKLLDNVFRQISDNPNTVAKAEAQINNIQVLLETNGFGDGLTADDRAYLEGQLTKDRAFVDFAGRTVSVADDIIAEARNLSSSNTITDTGIPAARQLLDDYLASLTPQELKILESSGQLDNLLVASGQQFRSLGAGEIFLTPFTPEATRVDPSQSAFQTQVDAAVQAWVAQNGSITDAQYDAIVEQVAAETRVSPQFPGVLGADAERDTDTGGFFLRTSTSSTTVSAADTDTVLIGNDTPPPPPEPAARGGAAPSPVSTGVEVDRLRTIAAEAPPRSAISRTPASTGGNFTESFDPNTGTWEVVNLDNGEVVATGLSQQQATVEAQNASVGDPSYGQFLSASSLTEEQIQALDNPTDVVDPRTAAQIAADDAAIEAATGVRVRTPDPGVDPRTPAQIAADDARIAAALKVQNTSPAPVGNDVTVVFNEDTGTFDVIDLDSGATVATGLTEQQAILAAQEASVGITNSSQISTPPGVGPNTQQQATLAKAQAQSVLAAQQKQANQGDWRVKLRLAPGANYLYRANDGKGTQAGILQPLAVTDGVVFPYTPVIATNYRANYSNYDLTHSNYRGYFYQGSSIEEVTIQATFTAQDTYEANYLLAVIHFFKSVTKMFYGQDAERGAPPPLVYLQGLGEYQFNLHPCVVSNFNYTLPNDVDYIRARSPNINGTNLLQARQRQTVATNPFSEIIQRLQNAGLPRGGINTPPPPPTLGTNSPTYVPTKMDMTITLLPIQSREQQSQQFSLKQYANGDLLKGGFW